MGSGTAFWPRIHSRAETSLDYPLRRGAKRNDTCRTNTILIEFNCTETSRALSVAGTNLPIRGCPFTGRYRLMSGQICSMRVLRILTHLRHGQPNDGSLPEPNRRSRQLNGEIPQASDRAADGKANLRSFLINRDFAFPHCRFKSGMVALSLVCVGQRKFAHRHVELIS
jgi:hypothetical protein